MRVRKENEEAVRRTTEEVWGALETALDRMGIPLSDPVTVMVAQSVKEEVTELIDLMFWKLGR